MSVTKPELNSMTDAELSEALAGEGITGFRVEQITRWVRKGVTSFDEMGNLPKNTRENLDTRFALTSVIISRKRLSSDGTVKYLFTLHDGETVETVLMRYRYGNSVCISTQAGCAMGCVFCASGRLGLRRHLTAGELCGQVLAAVTDSGEPVSRVVLMGIGEPLHNLDATLRFVALAAHPFGLGIGARHISVSTCGLVDRINELAALRPQFTLSVSLHAPNDRLRNRIMPVNKRFPVDELLAACRRYTDQTGRRISIEYALINGFNDSDECADELVSKLKGMLVHVNLIPLNDNGVKNGYKAPARVACQRFADRLSAGGLAATVRRTLGDDIEAACGQLRAVQAQETYSRTPG